MKGVLSNKMFLSPFVLNNYLYGLIYKVEIEIEFADLTSLFPALRKYLYQIIDKYRNNNK